MRAVGPGSVLGQIPLSDSPTTVQTMHAHNRVLSGIQASTAVLCATQRTYNAATSARSIYTIEVHECITM
jgi:hypothetical protein